MASLHAIITQLSYAYGKQAAKQLIELEGKCARRKNRRGVASRTIFHLVISRRPEGGRGGTYNTRNRAFYMLLRRFNVIINHGGCERGVRMPLAELNFVGSNGLPL